MCFVSLINLVSLDNDTLVILGLLVGVISVMAIVVVGMQMELEKNQFQR